VSAWPAASAITYGSTLASSTLSGGSASVSGTFSWTTPTTAPGAGSASEGVTFTPSDTTDYNAVTGAVSVTVNKATPMVSAWPTASAINYGQTLSSSTLTGGTASVGGTFAWTNSSTEPNAGTASEGVTFTPTDTTDYNTVAGAASVAVSEATPTVTAWPTASAITYGQTLSNSTLTGGTASVPGAFAWTTSTTEPSAGTNPENVTFTPTDTTDYTMVTGTVILTVSKVTPTVTAWPTASAITYGQTLASSTLTGGTASVGGTFAWTTPSTEPSLGTVSEGVTFTPTDTTDYNTVTGTASVTVNPTQVTVDFGTTFQTVRGFGGSTAWLGEMPSAVATALFSPTSGLGLNILRVRIDPEGSPSSANPYETSQWDYEAANGREAVAANPKAIVFASPWTPPATWKLSGTTTTVSGTSFNEAFNGSCGEGAGYCGGYLNPTNYANYASYLEDFVHFFNTTNSFNLYAISMQNEPEENVTYESCVWTPQQMDTWIAGNASTITSDPYSTKLIMPESDVFNPVDAATALSDSSAEGLISIIGGHIYQVLSEGSIVSYSIPAGDSPKELWMTEFGPLSGTPLTWAQALTTYGESIHNSMVTGQYNAYVWWGVFGSSTGSCSTAAGTCGFVDNAGTVQPMGYVMGQYSKFIQPGYVRVSATATPVSGVFVSAYMNSSPAHYVIVAINSNTTSESLTFALSNGSGVTSLMPTQSTSAAGLAAQTAVPVSGGQFNYTLPAQSIVTFYQ
jgi:O-glycosyl hydrolase